MYLRELLQNAVDAITARRSADPDAPAVVAIDPPEVTGDGTVRVRDSGIGLSEREVHELLATIGRSSKRDELGLARHEFLGQFGIFLVADEVRVLTRSARGGPTVEWTGLSDGRYRVLIITQERPEAGTTVTLRPRPGMEQWLSGEMVRDLAVRYGDALPVEISIAGRRVNSGALPWRHGYSSLAVRGGALREYA